LVWVAEPSTYEDFKDQDLLLQFTPEAADALGEEMKDPEGYYYAGRVINMVLVYNESVEPVPTSWADLTSDAHRMPSVAALCPLLFNNLRSIFRC
jgi:iron(III) transport system substrate-binding protein